MRREPVVSEEPEDPGQAVPDDVFQQNDGVLSRLAGGYLHESGQHLGRYFDE